MGTGTGHGVLIIPPAGTAAKTNATRVPDEEWEVIPQAGTAPRTNATRVPDQEWEAQKDTLRRLYIDENRTLKDIISFMQNDQHFHAGKRQYVHRFQKWGWKKYGNSNAERMNQVLHSSGQGEEDEDERDEPGPAPQKLVQELRIQRPSPAVRDETPSEGSSTCFQSVSSSSHNYRAHAPQRRDYFPRPLTLQEKAPVTMHAEPVPITPSRDEVLDPAKLIQTPKAGGQDSLSQVLRTRARKNTEHDTGDDMVEENELRRPKKFKTGKGDLKLACPFRKRNPQRFNVMHHTNCALSSFADFALLKRHIKTCHQAARGFVSCVRCKEQFADQAALKHHLIQPVSCSLVSLNRDEDPEDGITEEVDQALKERRKDSNISGWLHLWALLFPKDDLEMIPGPDFEPVIESHQLENYLLGRTHDLAEVLRSELHAHGSSIDISVDIKSFLQLALLKAVQDFRRENFQEVPRL